MQVRELIAILQTLPDCLPVHFCNADATSFPSLQRVEMMGRMVVLYDHLITAQKPEVIKAFDGQEYVVEKRYGKPFVDYRKI